jgi:hypothetical protein
VVAAHKKGNVLSRNIGASHRKRRPRHNIEGYGYGSSGAEEH